MTRRSTRVLAALGVLGAGCLVRGPLHAVTFGLPVSNDDAILLLMARHIQKGELATTLWNQPYNGALDAYLLAPVVAVAGSHHGYRLYEAACALLLVACVGLLARSLAGERAGWIAALLAAWGTPYMGLMTATGPPPNFLMPLLTGFPLLAALRRPDRDVPPVRPAAAMGLGLICGLAVWCSSLAVPAFFGMGVGLLAAGFRPSRRAAWGLAGFALGASPLLLARLIGASGASVTTAASAVTALRPRWLWGSGLCDLGSAATTLFGLRVPLVVDGPEKAALPIPAVVALGIGLGVAVLAGVSLSRKTLPLLGWSLTLAGAFALSRRTGADELRYLYGLNAPVLALAGIGLARIWSRWAPLAVALGLATLLPWGLGERNLVQTWRDPRHAARMWQVPPLDPVRDALARDGIGSAYASLQFAGRLTLESEGRVLASQAWNERIPGDPLRFRDEVDLDPNPAWVLSPTLSRGMPRAPRFRDLVREMGGTVVEETAGDLVVFRSFTPPFDEGRPVPAVDTAVLTLDGVALPAAVRDRNPQTSWTSPTGIGRGSGLRVHLAPARRVSALVFVFDLVRSPLAVPWVLDVGGEIVSRGPSRHGLQWVGGAPRAGRQGLLAVPLGDRVVDDARLIFQGTGPPLTVREVFAYGPDEAAQPRTGEESARLALASARRGDWSAAADLYARARELEPDRASFHAAWARASWRAGQRRWLDVEGIDDGGPDLVLAR